IKSDAPSICTSQLAWPIHVSRAGSPGAGAFRRTARSGFTAGTSALAGLRRRRPVTLSTTAQRNTSEPGFGPDPSRLRKRVMRSPLPTYSRHVGRAMLLCLCVACAAPRFVVRPRAGVTLASGVEHGEGTFIGALGLKLYEQWWRPASHEPRAVLVIVHGLKD